MHKTWKQVQVLEVVKYLIDHDFKYIRFTKQDIVDAVYAELPTLEAARELALTMGTDLSISTQVGSVLRKRKDDENHRVFINDGKFWFHRSASTPHEQIDYGTRIRTHGDKEAAEGNWHIEQGRKRLRKGRSKK